TGLPNQAKFADHLHLALRRRERRGGTISVLAVDLDGSRLANDSLGTRAGDQLLRHAGARIARAAVSAEMVARRSADEFLILLTDLRDTPAAEQRQPWVSAERAPQETAHSVQTALAEPIRVDDREIYLGACVGVAVLAEREAADDHDQTVEPLGAWVMDEVARQARIWDQEGMEFEIAFNLSPRQLSQRELLPSMRTSLAAAEVPFDRFVVEITESSALRDFDSTVALLRQMTAEGFRLAIDDFGVELSSLSRLLQIPAHILKVDQSFISALSTSPDAAVMVQMIIQLAEKLGRRPHAEGVESEKKRRFLREYGCQYGQGYLFSKP